MTREGWILVGSVIGLFALVICGVIALCSFNCNSQWRDSGYASRYSAIGGCQVNINGRWLPERAVRSFD